MSTLTHCTNPLTLFTLWLEEAATHPYITEPTAMCLATVNNATPSARMVLLKEYDANGFVFYTNLESRKSNEIIATETAALCFYWMPLDRQVRIVGRVEAVEAHVADAYFATRERNKQIGAWASVQSRPMQDRSELEARIEEMTQRFEGKEVSRPPYWSGWRVIPHEIELWQQRDFRWHERCVFMRNSLADAWQKTWLYP